MSARRRWAAPVIVALVAAVATVGMFAQPQAPDEKAARPAEGNPRNFDARVGLQGLHVFVPREAQQQAVNDLRDVMRDLRVEFDQATGATRSLWNMGGFLTPADGRDPEAIAEDYMRGQALLLGLSDSDVVDVELTDRVYSDLTGVTHLYYRQRLNGIPVYNAQLHFNIAKDGRILSVNNQFLPSLTMAVPTVRPAMDAAAAVRFAGAHLGVSGFAPIVEGEPRGLRRTTELSAPELSSEPITAELMLIPLQRGEARLVWNFQIFTLDSEHAFDMTVDAETGQIWTRFDWVAADSYRVYPIPVESPIHTTPAPPSDARVLVFDPRDATASPFGWHDTNGAAGAEFTTTQGNNVHAYTDTNNDGVPDTGSSPNCGVGLNCDFAINLAGAPSTYQPAAVTNLFYWNNIVHDVQYRYGFNEVAGNFQVNNYGRGGLGADDVRAEAQDGGGTNNANFLTPADGSRPRMQMYIWNLTTPNRDGDLDAGIIVHEYGHGISNRLVGGPSNVSCLGNSQQPGEGISDWLALVYTARSTDTAAQARGVGTYALGQAANGPGIRDLPYSTDNAVNNWTYASISSLPSPQIPHRVGAVWAQGMWEVYWALVSHYGFDPNLYNATGSAGNQRAMLYHNEGMKFTSCSPGFTQLRDGIIQAAQSLNGGADVCRLWTAFAGFGLGSNAVNPSPGSITGIVNGFNVPASCGGTPDPSFSINDVSQNEGNAGTTNFTFTVTRANPGVAESRVNWATANGTATALGGPGVTIPSGGQASIYPSTITVAGAAGTISNLRVRLFGLSHTWPDDLDILLVGPGGQTVMLMSDAGGSTDMVNVNLEFQDGAAAVPDNAAITSGTYSPTNYGSPDNMPAPAPAEPYGTALSVFNGTSANGTWSLYVYDDLGGDAGSLVGWSLAASGLPQDYQANAGQLVFGSGVTTQTVTVVVNGDTAVEPNETFFVNLSDPVNGTITDAQGVGTILNDDGPMPVQPPANLRVDRVSGSTVTLRWTPPAVGPAPTQYVVKGGTTPGSVLASLPTGSTAATYTFTAPTGSFFVRVHSLSGATESAASNEVPLHVNVPVAPSAPANLLGLVNGSTVTLGWRNTYTGGEPTSLVVDVTGGTTASLPMGVGEAFSFAGVPGGTYTFRVRGQNAGGAGAFSNAVTLTFPTACTGAPQAPTGLIAYKVATTLGVMWDPPAAGPTATSYILDVTGAVTTSIPTGGRALSGAVLAGTYNLSVRAVNACGTGPASPVQVIAVP